MIQDAFWGILIPFLGTSLGAGCVFFLKKSLSDGLYLQVSNLRLVLKLFRGEPAISGFDYLKKWEP